jgi:hypothetical protein
MLRISLERLLLLKIESASADWKEEVKRIKLTSYEKEALAKDGLGNKESLVTYN